MYVEELKQHLKKRTGCADRDIQIVYAPLRISPLGAHVDHQDGLVTGMTLDRVIWLAFTPRNDRRVCIESLNFPNRVEFALDDIPPKSLQGWGNYARGAALALQQQHVLQTGIDAVVGGEMHWRFEFLGGGRRGVPAGLGDGERPVCVH